MDMYGAGSRWRLSRQSHSLIGAPEVAAYAGGATASGAGGGRRLPMTIPRAPPTPFAPAASWRGVLDFTPHKPPPSPILLMSPRTPRTPRQAAQASGEAGDAGPSTRQSAADRGRDEVRTGSRTGSSGRASLDAELVGLLALAVRWRWDGDSGRHARSKLWRVCEESRTPTGKIRVADADRFVRRLLRCPAGFASRKSVERLFRHVLSVEASPPLSSPTPPRRRQGSEAMDCIEPGAAFWRLLLLVTCYLQIYLTFAPAGGMDAPVAAGRWEELAAFICRYGAPAWTPQEATAFAAGAGGVEGSLESLCDWGVERLLQARGATSANFFSDLERRLTSPTAEAAGELRPRPMAVPLKTML